MTSVVLVPADVEVVKDQPWDTKSRRKRAKRGKNNEPDCLPLELQGFQPLSSPTFHACYFLCCREGVKLDVGPNSLQDQSTLRRLN